MPLKPSTQLFGESPWGLAGGTGLTSTPAVRGLRDPVIADGPGHVGATELFTPAFFGDAVELPETVEIELLADDLTPLTAHDGTTFLTAG